MSPQPSYHDGGWEAKQRSKFVWEPGDIVLCSCPKLNGERFYAPTCGIHGSKPHCDSAWWIRNRLHITKGRDLLVSVSANARITYA